MDGMGISIRRKIKIRSLFSGIARKFIIYFIFFSIVPILFISFLGYKISERIVIDQNSRYLALGNMLVENRLINFFNEAEFDVSRQNPRNKEIYLLTARSSAKDLAERCGGPSPLVGRLSNRAASDTIFSALVLVDPEGKILCSSNSAILPILAKVAVKPLGKIQSVAPAGRGFSSNSSMILVFPNVTAAAGENIRLAGIVNKRAISSLLRQTDVEGQITRTYIFGSKNELLFSSLPDSMPVQKSQIDAKKAPLSSGSVIGWDHKKVLRAVREYRQTGWHIVSDLAYSSATADLMTFRNQAIFGVGSFLVLLIGLAFYLSQRLSVPIRQLVYTAQDIGDGLLETPIQIKSDDEIGMLAKELDEMRKKLLDYYENLENKVATRSMDLQRAQFQIVHQEKMASIGLLAAGIAHEIGNPLTAISSLTQLLARRLKDETNQNYLNTIMKNIDRISRIVRELVDFSRPSSFESRLTNINDIMQAAVGIVKYDRRSKNINFRLKLDPEIPHTVLVADQLLQVFINILFNAVDAMEGYGNDLSVQTAVEDDTIIIRIEDTGSGIPQVNLNKIFEPFYTTKGVGKGTGLGLSVSYGIIRNFNGKISVESTEGKGSVFSIRLPVRKSAKNAGDE